MYRNNFDTSSTGTNIEFTGCYDLWLSRAEFDDNFSTLKSGRNGAELLFYCDWGNSKTEPLKIGDAFKLNKHAKKSDILDLDYFGGETFAEIKRELLNKPIEDWEDFDSVLDLKAGFTFIYSRGYCQGDFVKVLINLDELEKNWGNKPDLKALQKEIDRLCWDAPIYASFIINGNEYAYQDYDLDRYDWQREEFAELVSKESGVSKETLLAMMPETLNYE